jgi:hypothetical protein
MNHRAILNTHCCQLSKIEQDNLIDFMTKDFMVCQDTKEITFLSLRV